MGGGKVFVKFVVLGLFVGICNQAVTGYPEGVKFPESASEDSVVSSSTSEAGKVIEEILGASRAGRNLRLSVSGGGEDLEPLASDPKLRELSTETGKDNEARSYIATKLCSLGLAKCGDERHGGGGGQYGQGNYGLTNIRDVTLVQPVALKPVGEPIAAIPLEKPFSSVGNGNYYDKTSSSSFGSFPSENKNFANYQNQQGGFVNPQDCTCVPINQCNSYDIVNPQPAGTGNNGVINGIGSPHFGQVGLGIDPRNKKSEIESNSTIIESEPIARSTRSHTLATEETSNVNVTIILPSNQTTTAPNREKREAPLFNTNPRIVNGGFQQQRGCGDSRYVCCKNPNRNPTGGSSYPSNGGSSYPSTGSGSYPSGVSYPITGTSGSYPSNNNGGSSSYPGSSGAFYPAQGSVSNQYYPPSNGACGKRNSNGINGRVLNNAMYTNDGAAEYGEYPWQAALLKKEGANNLFVCGATIIDSRHLLTAAHCIKSNRPENLRVRLGDWDVSGENEFYPHVEYDVAAIAVHPEYYAGNLVNDIAIIKLNGFVDFSKHPQISPICLPSRNHDFTGFRCYTTGWGKDAFGQVGKFQRILQEVDVPVLNHYECEQRLKRTRLGPDFNLHKGFLCAGGESGKDACKGDGGGPLSCDVGGNWQLAGIVSWGVGCGEYGTPGVYVKTSSYLDWIRNTIQ